MSEPFGLSRIGQIAVVVHDLPRAVAFYRDTLGMRLLFEAPPMMAFFDCASCSAEIDPSLGGSRSGGRSDDSKPSVTSDPGSPMCRIA